MSKFRLSLVPFSELTHDHHKASFVLPKRTPLIKRERTQRAVVAARGPARQDARVHPGGAGTRRARSARTPLGAASRRGGDGALWARGRRPADARPCVVGRRAVSDEAGADVDNAGRVARPNADERAGARAPPRGTFRLIMRASRSPRPFLGVCAARHVVAPLARRSVPGSRARRARRRSGVLDRGTACQRGTSGRLDEVRADTPSRWRGTLAALPCPVYTSRRNCTNWRRPTRRRLFWMDSSRMQGRRRGRCERCRCMDGTF